MYATECPRYVASLNQVKSGTAVIGYDLPSYSI